MRGGGGRKGGEEGTDNYLFGKTEFGKKGKKISLLDDLKKKQNERSIEKKGERNPPSSDQQKEKTK